MVERSQRKWHALAVPALAAVALVAPGCGALDKHRERQIPQYGMIDPTLPKELQKVSLPPHVIEPPDELDIAVRPSSLLDSTLPKLIVQTDGNIDLGFAGRVYLAGLTLEEAELKVAQHLAKIAGEKKVTDPIQVSLRLENGRDSKRYYVLGVVTTQNSFPITGNETVVDGILAAGLRSNSLPEKAYLVRPHALGGPDLVYKIDWCGITQRGDTLTNYQLLPGDRIYVPGGPEPGLLKTLLGGR
jgi:polysaccharide export outer membrane protein